MHHKSSRDNTRSARGKAIIPLLATVLLTVSSLASDDYDTIKLTNPSGGETGAWVSETKNGSYEGKVVRPQAGVDTVTGSYTGAPGAVIAYADKRTPTWKMGVGWSNVSDTVTLKLEDTVQIDLHVWIVNGDYQTIEKRAKSANVRTSEIWLDERQGIEFSSFTVHDATNTRDQFASEAFHCSRASDIKGAGFQQGAINVYYVETVLIDYIVETVLIQVPESTAGVYCGSDDLIALGVNSKDDILVHELGHAFSLEHVDNLSEHFNRANVMVSGGEIRNFLTEGQTYRAIANSASAINRLYKARSSDLKCSTLTDSLDCPPVQTRIWEDGGETEKISESDDLVSEETSFLSWLTDLFSGWFSE